MSAIGTGYDLSASQYSPDGRVFQVEYAKKAVDNGSNLIAIKGTDGVVIATEKLTISVLHEPGNNPRIFSIGEHISCGVAGFYPDAVALVTQSRAYVEEFYEDHGHTMPVTMLKERLGAYVAAYTCSSAARPFGATIVLAGYDKEPYLYAVDPAGAAVGYHYLAAGKAKQAAKSELEKLGRMTCRELVNHAARIIHQTHDEVKDKGFILELSWVGEFTNGLHELVPEEILNEAKEYAKNAIQDDSSDEEMTTRHT